MAAKKGNFVKIDRKMLQWGWYTDINTTKLFLHCILKANWKEGEFQGQIIRRGEFVTSLPKLAQETGLTERNVRTALNHLKSTGEVTDRATRKYRIISVINYDLYQDDDRQSDSQLTDSRQTSDSQPSPNRRRQEGKKGRMEEGNRLACAPPSFSEVKEYMKDTGVDAERFYSYYSERDWTVGDGTPVRNWRSIADSWARSEKPRPHRRGPTYDLDAYKGYDFFEEDAEE